MKLDLHVMNPEKPSIGTIIWMHGIGSNHRNYGELVKDFWHEEAIPLRFIFPNAPIRPVTINHYIPTRAWYDLYSITDLEREDKTGINASEFAITRIIQDEINQGTNPKHILVAGFSQGGAIALYTGLRQKHPIGGILALSCYLPLHQEHHEKAHPANLNTPIFMAHGTQDPICPYVAGKKTYEIVSQTHINSQWREYEIGHEITPVEIADVKRWLKQVFMNHAV